MKVLRVVWSLSKQWRRREKKCQLCGNSKSHLYMLRVNCQLVKRSIMVSYPWAGKLGASKETLKINLRVYLWNKCDSCLCINSINSSSLGQFCPFSFVRTSYHIALHPDNLPFFKSSCWISDNPYHEISEGFFFNFLKLIQMDFCSCNQRIFTETI